LSKCCRRECHPELVEGGINYNKEKDESIK